jgi:chromate reductase, NAD(P)H dehydrogenase (quinone)
MTVKLLAFAGSTRNGSLNQALLDLAVTEARAKGAEVTTARAWWRSARSAAR